LRGDDGDHSGLRDLHFYLTTALFTGSPLRPHRIHHTNADVGPTGLSMHPVEHLLYWSGVAIH
jgi:hypothetical protein